MRDFNKYYSDEVIIKYLCKIRIAYADKRKKRYLLNKLTTKENYLVERENQYENEIQKQLTDLLPSRRLWLTNGQRTYKWIKNKKTGEKSHVKIQSDVKHLEILFNTINKYRNENSNLEFIKKLNEFINDIQNSIEGRSYKISPPDILPEIKELNKSKLRLELKRNGKNECRPISRFRLKDRIIISITNKFFTDLFDDYFENSSLAFRAVKKIGGLPTIKNHHTAINEIIKNKKNHSDSNLYVAECDMKKFFDTVNHKICLQAFDELITKAKSDNPNLELSNAIYIFKEYLNCYSFPENVEKKNDDDSYWKQQTDKSGKKIVGKFPWIEKEKKSSKYYTENPNDRIGIPQGGALSGLIANIVLDYADKKLKDREGLFYVRYCDDMILMHKNIDDCILAMDIYKKAIFDLHLFNHDFKKEFVEKNDNSFSRKLNQERKFKTKKGLMLNRSYKNSIKPFWGMKSKGPYLWGKLDIENNTFPWIGFVGYEIYFNGETRIRKKSLKKETEKQKKVIRSIISIIRKKKNARNGSILRSAYEKLNGMSVGRIKIYDYKKNKNIKCWTDGFQSLTFNETSKKQLRVLDRNKYKQISILKKALGNEEVDSDKIHNSTDEIYNYKKPFSYYFQAGEKKHLLKKVELKTINTLEE